MLGFFKSKEKTESEVERSIAPYPRIQDLRIGAAIEQSITDLALGKGAILVKDLPETMLVRRVDTFEIGDAKVARYVMVSGVIVEIVYDGGDEHPNVLESVLYTQFDSVPVSSEEDAHMWLGENEGMMGMPVFTIDEEEETLEFGRMINDSSDHWTPPIDISVKSFEADPYGDVEDVKTSQCDRAIMIYCRDIEETQSHERILIEFDENDGVINLFAGIPITLNDLDIT